MIFYDIKDTFESYFVERKLAFLGFNATYKSIELAYVNKELEGMPLYEEVINRSVVLTFSFSKRCIFTKARSMWNHNECHFSIYRNDPYETLCQLVEQKTKDFFYSFQEKAENSIAKEVIEKEIDGIEFPNFQEYFEDSDYVKNRCHTDAAVQDLAVDYVCSFSALDLEPVADNLQKIKSINEKINEIYSIIKTMEHTGE